MAFPGTGIQRRIDRRNPTVVIERHDVRAVPVGAVMVFGNQTCCYFLENGKEVNGVWTTFTGGEQVILGDLSELVDGEAVQTGQ